MEKKIYIVRHCKAEGQSLDAPLTSIGYEQANNLAQLFNNIKIDRIISSPFRRAIQSIEPTIQSKNLNLEIDNRLSERTLSSKDLPDWLEKLELTFSDLDLKYEGGESSKEAMNRIVNLIDEVKNDYTIIVTHGNIMSLLIKHFNNDFSFEHWSKLSNPDVFVLTINHSFQIKRIWNEANHI
jgi:2,3-bisphosphoglycerate-dependent phosphoglycerate mutase